MRQHFKKLCKTIVSLGMVIGLTCSSIPLTPAYAASDIMVFVDGEYLSADVPPYTKNGYTMLPMRAVYETLGAEVVYEKTNRQITVYKDERIITLFVDKKVGYVNGSAIPLSAPPEIKNGRTMVGLRDGATLIGADIEWDSVSRTVNVWTDDSSYYEDDWYYDDEEYYEDDWYYEDEEYYDDEEYYEEDWYYDDEEYYEEDWYYDEYYEEYSLDDIEEGKWWDLDSQRCHLKIDKKGSDSARVEVNWSSSAFENTRWVLDCEWDSAAGILWYEDGEMYSEFSNDKYLEYDNGTGYFYLEGEYLYWVDEVEDAGRDCYFEYTPYSNAVTWEEEENCDAGHTKGLFLYTDYEHPHYKYYECDVCYEEFTDGSKGVEDSCTICNPVKQGYWGNWSSWSTNKVTASDTRKVETREVKVSDAYTQYRYGRYVDSTGKHDCWCSKYFQKLSYTGITLQYSDWSKTRYSTKGSDWTCGNCNGNHIGVHHTSSDGRDWWREYNVGGKSYYWEESRTVSAKYETQYRYSDWVE